MPAPLQGKHALVTGGGRGIGRAIAAALTETGARVTVLGRSPGPLDAAVAAGAAAARVTADVTDTAALEAAFFEAAATAPIDILVNNAGAAESAPFKRLDRAHWDRIVGLDLTSVYEATRLVIEPMAARGYGRIVNIASIAGLTGMAYTAAYCAAKHGVVGLTRALAVEYAKTGVTVNAVCPGYVDTDLVRDAADKIAAKTGKGAQHAVDAMVSRTPMGRLITPEEVAAAVLWLVGPGAGAVTGAAVPIGAGEIF
jgi:NAD(P)-dependent dehydrogenase (short-subunit alcohol dehydrogenase family)